MGTDFVIGVSDAACDGLNLVFNTTPGRNFLSEHKGLGQQEIAGLSNFGLSSIANILGAIKYAKYMDLGENDVVLIVATDGSDLCETEQSVARKKYFSDRFDKTEAAETFGRFLLGCATDHMIELSHREKERIFNLGYYTWVEQQGISVADFDRRRDQSFWDGLMDLVPVWDSMIDDFNG